MALPFEFLKDTLGLATDAAATGDGSLIGIVKQLRTLLSGTLSVSGGLTDTELRDSDVVVSLDGEEVSVAAPAGITVSQTPTITAGAYSAGDAVGGKLEFANAARDANGGGWITNMSIVDDAGQDVEMELWLFSEDFTAIADNAAAEFSEADLENLVTVISTSLDSWIASGTPSAIDVECTRRYDCTNGGTSLYGQHVTRGTPTFVATDDLTTKLRMARD
jgi:hypothetical protein